MPTTMSECRGRGWGIEFAAIVPTVTTVMAPTTHARRKGRADVFRLSDRRMRIVAMIGTELKAAATAMGSSDPNACVMAPRFTT